MQPDIVKLDRILTEGIHGDPARMVLIESFVRFARRGASSAPRGLRPWTRSRRSPTSTSNGGRAGCGRPTEPWAKVPVHAARVCRAGLDEAMRPVPWRRRRSSPETAGWSGSAPASPPPAPSTTWRTRCPCWRPRSTPTTRAVAPAPRGRGAGDPRRDPQGPSHAVRPQRVAADGPGAANTGGGAGDEAIPGSSPRRSTTCSSSATAVLILPVVYAGAYRRPGGLLRAGAALVANRDQPRPDHRQPGRLGLPVAGRHPGAEAALTRMRRASGAPSACLTRDPEQIGPSNGSRPVTRMPAPGRIPREPR